MTAVAEPAAMPAASSSRRGATRKGAAAGTDAAPPAVSAVLSAVQLVPVVLLDDHPLNPREELTELEDLAQSISEQGLLQNLTVVPTYVVRGGDAIDDGRYTVLIGHRRKAAAAIAKVAEVPCVVRRDVTTSSQALQIMLVENLQRVDISPLSEARAYAQLVDEGMSQRDIADKVGRNQSHISKRLALLKLPDVARDAVLAGQVSLNEAAAVASVADRPEVFDLAWNRVTGYGWAAKDAVSHAVDEVERQATVAAVRTELESQGARVLTGTYLASYDYGSGNQPTTVSALPAAARKKHEEQPCHVAHIGTEGKVTWGCDNPKAHRPKQPKPKGPSAAEKARAEAAEAERVQARDARLEVAQRALRARSTKQLEDFAITIAVLQAIDCVYIEDDAIAQLLGIDLPQGNDAFPALKQYAAQSRDNRIRLLAAIAIDEAESQHTYTSDLGREPYEQLLEAHGWTRPEPAS